MVAVLSWTVLDYNLFRKLKNGTMFKGIIFVN